MFWFIRDLKGGDILRVKFASEVDGALVAKWEALEHVNEDSSTENRVLGSGKSSKQFIARTENDQTLLFEVFLYCCQSTRRVTKAHNVDVPLY